MIVKNIEIKNFRNYQNLDLNFSPTINIFVGQNAQGKTNLLESIYLLSLSNSHRTNDYKELINWDEKESLIKADVQKTTGNINLEIRLTGKGKIAKVNSLTTQALTEFVGNLNVVLFAPEDLLIVKGSPQKRRNFMNAEFSQISNKYLYDLSTFRKVLKNRNAFLKKNENDDLFLEVLDNQIAQISAKIIQQRFKFVDMLTEIAREVHREIAPSENLSISYKTIKIGRAHV